MNNTLVLFIFAGSIASVGGFILLWSLFYDWFRNRKKKPLRCPKCRYDMHSAHSLVCPECGNDAKHERHLKKFHRRWKMATLGLLMVLLAVGGYVDQRYRLVKWLTVLPSWLLLEMVDDFSPPDRTRLYLSGARVPAASNLHEELWDRYSAGQFSTSQRAKITKRQFDDNHNWVNCNTRDRWPIGVPIWVEIHANISGPFSRDLRITPKFIGADTIGLYSQGWRGMVEDFVQIGIPTISSNGINLDYEVREGESLVWSDSESLRTVVSGSVDDILEPVRGGEETDILRQAFINTLHISPDGSWISVTVTRFDDITVAAKVEILEKEVVVAWTDLFLIALDTAPPGRFGSKLTNKPTEIYLKLNSESEQLHTADFSDSNWQIRLRGDGGAALRDLLTSRYWADEIVLPLRQD